MKETFYGTFTVTIRDVVYWLDLYEVGSQRVSFRLDVNLSGSPSDVPSAAVSKLLTHAIDQLRDVLAGKAIFHGDGYLLYHGNRGLVPTLLRQSL